MKKDHKILAGAVLTGVAIGALVLALNSTETEICVNEDAISYAPYTYGHGIKESAEMACIFYKMIGLINKHENTKS